MAGAVLTLGGLTAAAIDAGEPFPADLKDSISELSASLAAAAERDEAGADKAAAEVARAVRSAERLLPAPVTHAPVMASMTTICGCLVLHTEQMHRE